MENVEWTCPYCDRVQTLGHPNRDTSYNHFYIGSSALGNIGCTSEATRCLNASCQKVTVDFFVHEDRRVGSDFRSNLDKIIFAERLMPRGASKPLPEYIPEAIRCDYHEACLIRDLSPKASATLSRRCLQGMIRDFAGIVKGTLDAEIKTLIAAVKDNTAPRAITVESAEAIDHVRKVGNIGAHMEKDINVIIDVDAGEAQALINLIELLLKEWYVDRHQRQERLKAVETISTEKAQAKLQAPVEQKALPAS